MTLQKRLKKVMRDRNLRVADLARRFNRPYTTVREWVLHGREPGEADQRFVDRRLKAWECR